jgi:redox-sensing transcriptional repressor
MDVERAVFERRNNGGVSTREHIFSAHKFAENRTIGERKRFIACAALKARLIFRALKKNGRPIIPRKTIYRLSIYLRCLARLKENGIGTVSSEALAKAAGVKPTQLRKDLAYFGTFGTRGLGYDVAELSGKISEELGTSRLQPVILVGVGHLGLALVSYRGFEKEGFEIVAAFDADPQRQRDKQIKQPIFGMESLAKFVTESGVKMAILTVPAAAAQEVANALVRAGVAGILNFAPIVLDVPEEVMVNNVNLAIELENLSYFTQE